MYYGRIAIYGGYSSFCSFIPYSVLYCVLCDMFVLLAVRIEKGRGVSRASGWMEDIHGMHVLCEAWYGFVLVWHGRILYMFTIKVREERLMRMPAHTVVLACSKQNFVKDHNDWENGKRMNCQSVGWSVCRFVRTPVHPLFWHPLQYTMDGNLYNWQGQRMVGSDVAFMVRRMDGWWHGKLVRRQQGKLIASNVVIHLYMHKRKNYGLSAGRTVVAPVVWFGWLAGLLCDLWVSSFLCRFAPAVGGLVCYAWKTKNEKYGKTTFSSLFCCSRVESIKYPIQNETRNRLNTDDSSSYREAKTCSLIETGRWRFYLLRTQQTGNPYTRQGTCEAALWMVGCSDFLWMVQKMGL